MGEMTDRQPGTVKGLHLVVANIHTARAALAGRGVTVSAIDDPGASSMSTSVTLMATHG